MRATASRRHGGPNSCGPSALLFMRWVGTEGEGLRLSLTAPRFGLTLIRVWRRRKTANSQLSHGRAVAKRHKSGSRNIAMCSGANFTVLHCCQANQIGNDRCFVLVPETLTVANGTHLFGRVFEVPSTHRYSAHKARATALRGGGNLNGL